MRLPTGQNFALLAGEKGLELLGRDGSVFQFFLDRFGGITGGVADFTGHIPGGVAYLLGHVSGGVAYGSAGFLELGTGAKTE